MISKQCPRCSSANEASAALCFVCNLNFFAKYQEPAPDSEPLEIPKKVVPLFAGPLPVRVVSSDDKNAGLKQVWEVLHGLLWAGSGVGFVFLGFSLTASLGMAQSAPQEAAIAAMNIGYMVVLYGFTRSVSEILKTVINS